jgi:hypothetical protein
MEGLGFWIFIGLLLLAVITAGSREKIEKQRTLQRLIERNETIDEDLVNKLLERRGLFSKPGDAYRRLRAFGAFIMVAAIPVGGLAFAAVIAEDSTPIAGAVTAGTVFFMVPFFLGLGLFISSSFCEKPDQASGSA